LDGTIDKICIDYNEDDSCNSYAGEKSAYNTTRNNAYVGYMYGLTLSDTENVDQNRCLKLIGDTVNDYINDYPNQESCEINGGKWTNNSYEATHANVVSSTIKTNVDKFYETYIENNDNNKHYEKFLADTLFCNDKSLASLSIGADNSGLGFGLNNTSYKAQERLYYSEVTTPITKALPSLKCAVGATDNYSRFTSTLDMSEFLPNGLSINNDLKHPIALLTADELVLAGAFTKNLNQSYYLYDASKEGVGNISWWTGTPSNYSSNYARIFYSKEDERSIYQNPAYKTIGVRPVINLRANVLIDSGDGTKGDGAYTIKLS